MGSFFIDIDDIIKKKRNHFVIRKGNNDEGTNLSRSVTRNEETVCKRIKKRRNN